MRSGHVSITPRWSDTVQCPLLVRSPLTTNVIFSLTDAHDSDWGPPVRPKSAQCPIRDTIFQKRTFRCPKLVFPNFHIVPIQDNTPSPSFKAKRKVDPLRVWHIRIRVFDPFSTRSLSGRVSFRSFQEDSGISSRPGPAADSESSNKHFSLSPKMSSSALLLVNRFVLFQWRSQPCFISRPFQKYYALAGPQNNIDVMAEIDHLYYCGMFEDYAGSGTRLVSPFRLSNRTSKKHTITFNLRLWGRGFDIGRYKMYRASNDISIGAN